MKKILAITLAFMIFLCGCYEKIGITDTKDNYEKIIAFMLKEDDKSFIVIGKKYHYIFEPNKKFEYIINNKSEAFKFDIEDGSYKLEDDNAFAKFYVYIDKTKASKDILTWALKNNAIKSKDEKDYLQIKIELKGKFYIANTEVNNSIAKLDKDYRIIIQEDEISYTKLMLSPILVVGQTYYIVITGAIGVVLIIPFLLVDFSLNKVKELRESK